MFLVRRVAGAVVVALWLRGGVRLHGLAPGRDYLPAAPAGGTNEGDLTGCSEYS